MNAEFMVSLVGVVLTVISMLGVLIGFVIRVSVKSARIGFHVESVRDEFHKYEESAKKNLIIISNGNAGCYHARYGT